MATAVATPLHWVLLQMPQPRASLAILLLTIILCAVTTLQSPQAKANVNLTQESLAAEAWPDEGSVVAISSTVRAQRAAIIRDSAAAAGLTNAVLIAGIGEVETNFAHCWSEATWACKGPASSSCGGGPVIAGSADGPCSAKQGGLGLFQFDAGTYNQTIATYGPNIVTMSGNVSEVVPFLTTRAIQSVAGINTTQQALDWMNSIPVVDGDPDFEEWLYFIAWRYNGCKGCTSQQNKYRAGTHKLLNEMGTDFWSSSQVPPACPQIPADGITIEEDDDCHEAKGPSQYWRHENAGHGGTLSWTKATDSATTSNYGIWNLQFEEAGKYNLDVFSDGGEFGQSTQAEYKITFADGNTSVIIDQSSASGWISLGSFDFAAGTPYTVRLDDNTGEPWQPDPNGARIIFDALRVSPKDAAGAWQGLEESGTVAQNVEHRFETPLLPAGRYVFTLSGTNDADLYLRTGSAPTTGVFDCRPYYNGSSEVCIANLTQAAVIHLMVRGWAFSSQYRLVGEVSASLAADDIRDPNEGNVEHGEVEGGCAVASSSTSAWWLFLLAFVMLGRRRRCA